MKLWTSFAINGQPNDSEDRSYWPPMSGLYLNWQRGECVLIIFSIAGPFGPYARIGKKVSIKKQYAQEFVRNASERKETDYRPLLELIASFQS